MKYCELNYLRLKQSIRLVPKLLWTSILGLELREKVLFSRADFVRAFTKLTQNPPVSYTHLTLPTTSNV